VRRVSDWPRGYIFGLGKGRVTERSHDVRECRPGSADYPADKVADLLLPWNWKANPEIKAVVAV
jgi:hypothetical protein